MYLHGSRGDADIEKRLMDTEGEGEMHGESGVDACASACVNSQWELHMARAAWMRVHWRV